MSYLQKALTSPKNDYGPLPTKSHDENEEYADCPFIALPDIRQQDNYSCGAAITMSVGKLYGVGPNSLEEWKKLLGTNIQQSTSPDKIIKVLEDLGLQCVARDGMTKEDLCYYWKLGVPVICPIQEYMEQGDTKADRAYGHWVGVIGVAHGYVFTQDPSIDNVMDGTGADNAKGKMMIECEEFCKDWFDDNIEGKHFDRYGIAVFGKKLS